MIKNKRKERNRFISGLIIVALFIFGYLFQDNFFKGGNDVETVIGKVGALMVLPEGESPTIATVEDPAKLADQPFFERAKKGDRVLIFSKSGKVILYDEVNNKIIDVGPIVISEK